MCGICGIVRLRPDAPALDRAALRRIRDAMARRGPDGEGEWFSDDGTVALGHRRLAILDLSPAGAQPMADPTGRYRIVFNGEIYNFRELRSELEAKGDRFTTQSDTEVILALWAREQERCVWRLRGMFAFAVHDSADGSLTLVRDSFGIKPLYYESRRSDRELRFASQVRALEAGGADRELDAGGVVGFLLWGSVPEPLTIRRSVRAVPAGYFVVVRDGVVEEPRPIPPGPEFEDDAESDAAELMLRSVRAHLVSDVPVAVFLSSGLDSAMVTALAARERRQVGDDEPISTFTVTFEGWEGTARDEGPLAARVAAALGTRHLEKRLDRAEVSSSWAAALAAMDQPSIDGFNTFIVARAAHEAGIKVALSGLGGDELFGSYPSFRDVPVWMSRARRLRRLPGARLAWPPLARTFAPGRPKLQGLASIGSELPGAYVLRRGLFLDRELANVLGDERSREGLLAHNPVRHAERTLRSLPVAAKVNRDGTPVEGAERAWLAVQHLERSLYMRNQLLRDADWAAMASSLELRVPLVDVRLWSALNRASMLPAFASGKAALAQVIMRQSGREMPDELWSRPKSGFAVPVAEWMMPARLGERDSAGMRSRRIALAILEAWSA